jgi:hypothetical protein
VRIDEGVLNVRLGDLHPEYQRKRYFVEFRANEISYLNYRESRQKGLDCQ